MSVSGTPWSRLSADTRAVTSSNSQPGKTSIRVAEGNCSTREISSAATWSGFRARARSIISRISSIRSMYSGLRIRAMVCPAPIFLAN